MIRKETIVGPCRLILGDCLEVLPLLSGYDAIIMDPPYGVGLGTKSRNQKSEAIPYASYDDTVINLQSLVKGVSSHVLSCRHAAVTPGVANMWEWPKPTHVGSIYYPAASGCNVWGFSCWQPIFYYGKDPYAGCGSRPDSFSATEPAEPNGHPCPKPIGQWTKVVVRASAQGEHVLAPFMGSGTTGVACIKTGRQFTGIEIDETYYDIAVRRCKEAWGDGSLFDERTLNETPQLFG